VGPDVSQVFVVPYQDGVTPERSTWIAITDGNSWETGPEWSSNGNTLYFASERDGFRCLWGQRLAAATRRPSGVPFVVRHFHEAQRPAIFSLTATQVEILQFTSEGDKIVYNPTNVTGNIWMIKRAIKGKKTPRPNDLSKAWCRLVEGLLNEESRYRAGQAVEWRYRQTSEMTRSETILPAR
jgi:hypothetical protein